MQEKKQEAYEGVLIKESLADDRIIDLMNVHKIELWNTLEENPSIGLFCFSPVTKKFSRTDS